MGKLHIHATSRKEADEIHNRVEEFLTTHYPDVEFYEKKRIVTIECDDPYAMTEDLIGCDVFDPEEHDYTVHV